MSAKAALERALRLAKRLVAEGDVVFAAVSGGKDSAVALYVLSELRKVKRFELKAFHIDLGLAPALPAVEALAETVGVELRVVRARDYGVDIARASRLLRRPPCSVCGTVKRYLMNRVPRELGATKVATGHNADDVITFFLKDLAQGAPEWALKLKPITPSTHPKLLPKIRPVYELTGDETLAIAESLGLPLLRERCPLAPARGDWLGEPLKAFMREIERSHPGFRLQLVRGIAKLPDFDAQPHRLRECSVCGEPTSAQVCSFCRIVRALRSRGEG